jgi:transposase
MIAHPSLGNFPREIPIMAQPLRPDELGAILEPRRPKRTPRPKGGPPPVSDRAPLTGILFILKTGRPWEDRPCEMNCGGGRTGGRRRRDGPADGTGDRIPEVWRDNRRGADPIDGSRALIDRRCVRAASGGEGTGPSPVDRSQPGRQHHGITAANGIPLAARGPSANTNDIPAMAPLFKKIPAGAGPVGHPKKKPDALQGDRASDSEGHRQAWEPMGLEPVGPEKGIDDQSGLGQTRGPVERTLAWIHQDRRLRIREERRPDIHPALRTLACITICASALFGGFC